MYKQLLLFEDLITEVKEMDNRKSTNSNTSQISTDNIEKSERKLPKELRQSTSLKAEKETTQDDAASNTTIDEDFLDDDIEYIRSHGTAEEKTALEKFLTTGASQTVQTPAAALVATMPNVNVDTRDLSLEELALRAVIDAIKMGKDKYVPFIKLLVNHIDKSQIELWEQLNDLDEEKIRYFQKGDAKETFEKKIYMNLRASIAKSINEVLDKFSMAEDLNQRIFDAIKTNLEEGEKTLVNQLTIALNGLDARRLNQIISEAKKRLTTQLSKDYPTSLRLLAVFRYNIENELDIEKLSEKNKKIVGVSETRASVAQRKYDEFIVENETKKEFCKIARREKLKKKYKEVLIKKNNIMTNIPACFSKAGLNEDNLYKFVGIVDPQAVDDNGNTLLSLAYQSKNKKIVEFLLEKCHPDMKKPNNKGYQACFYRWAQVTVKMKLPKDAGATRRQLIYDQELAQQESMLLVQLDKCNREYEGLQAKKLQRDNDNKGARDSRETNNETNELEAFRQQNEHVANGVRIIREERKNFQTSDHSKVIQNLDQLLKEMGSKSPKGLTKSIRAVSLSVQKHSTTVVISSLASKKDNNQQADIQGLKKQLDECQQKMKDAEEQYRKEMEERIKEWNDDLQKALMKQREEIMASLMNTVKSNTSSPAQNNDVLDEIPLDEKLRESQQAKIQSSSNLFRNA
jgi:hypothetical protein